MENQLEIARETRSIEKAYTALDNGLLSFVADKLRINKDLSTAEKYTLLTAFVEDITDSVRVAHGLIFDHAGVDKTASKLAEVYNNLLDQYGYKDKQAELQERERQNAEAREEWIRANSPKSPLLPN